ncbi:MAG: acyltransferase [Thermoanaerobaculia bacterium]|nr:acyltransferase [Thermoanaerobaculia bacterium]
MRFRPEIEGLRAVAVLAVLVFHLDEAWLPGGFLGVDVFFVISGFLITRLVRSQLERGEFSLPSFWMRRIRRLFPALLFMVTTVLVVGGLVLIQPERADLGWQAVASLFSFANILFWRTTGGYWHNASENIALLHAWTLSLEEQFYLVYPILLLLLARQSRGRLRSTIAVLGILSFGLCVGLTPFKTQASFFLLPTRMWELLMGGYLALRSEPSTEGPERWTWLRGAGLAMVVVSFWVISPQAELPGAYPLLPCLGTILLLRYGSAPGLLFRILSWAPVAWVGRISYSLYLWHWPVLVFLRYLDPEPNTAAIVGLSFGLATVSYYAVERPFHRGFAHSDRWIGVLLALPLAAFLWLASVPVSPLMPESLKGFDSPRALSRGWQYEATDSIEEGGDGIVMGRRDEPVAVAVIGSSHARVLCPAVDIYLNKRGIGGVSLATSNLPLVSDVSDERHATVNRARADIVRRLRPQVVIVAGLWAGEVLQPDFSERFDSILVAMAEASDLVIVMGQVPVLDLPKRYRRAMRKFLFAKAIAGRSLDLTPRADGPPANAQVRSVVESLRRDDIVYVDAHALLVDDAGRVRLRHGDTFLFSNYHHLNDDGSEFVFQRLFEPILDEALVVR